MTSGHLVERFKRGVLFRWSLGLAGMIGLALGAGCGPAAPRPSERFIPDEPEAQRALVTALDRWKSGSAMAGNDGAPEVLFVDARFRDGETLVDYRIVAPQPWDRGRRFVVEMTVSPDTLPQTVRFVVLGINPLLVFRQEDFDMLANWMHPMGDPNSTPTETKPTRDGKAVKSEEVVP